LAAGALLKKLVRGPGGFRWQDVCVGVESGLAAFAASLELTFETALKSEVPQLPSVVSGIVFFLFLLVLSAIQQELEPALQDPAKQEPLEARKRRWAVFWLFVVSNLIGGAMLGFSAYQHLSAVRIAHN
jgi:glycerol uptake facilitator-like aquaporin